MTITVTKKEKKKKEKGSGLNVSRTVNHINKKEATERIEERVGKRAKRTCWGAVKGDYGAGLPMPLSEAKPEHKKSGNWILFITIHTQQK